MHTPARRYCFAHYAVLDPTLRERFQLAILRHLYDPGNPWPDDIADSLDEGGASVLDCVLRRIETVDPACFPSLGALRAFLLQAADTTREVERLAEESGQRRWLR